MRACILNALAQRIKVVMRGIVGVECNRQVEDGKETNRCCEEKLHDDNLAS